MVYSYDTLGRLTQVLAGRTPSPRTTAASDVTTLHMSYAFDDFGRGVVTQHCQTETPRGFSAERFVEYRQNKVEVSR